MIMELKKIAATTHLPNLLRKCIVAMQNVSINECNIGEGRNAERNYVSTLRCRICGEAKFEGGYSCMISNDVVKTIDLSFEEMGHTIKKLNIKSKNFFPDLIFHESHDYEDCNPEHQHMVCEVKTCKNVSFNDFAKDFFKLNVYVSNQLNYKIAVYIMVHFKENLLLKRFEHYVNEGYWACSDFDKIYFLVQPEFGCPVTAYQCSR